MSEIITILVSLLVPLVLERVGSIRDVQPTNKRMPKNILRAIPLSLTILLLIVEWLSNNSFAHFLFNIKWSHMLTALLVIAFIPPVYGTVSGLFYGLIKTNTRFTKFINDPTKRTQVIKVSEWGIETDHSDGVYNISLKHILGGHLFSNIGGAITVFAIWLWCSNINGIRGFTGDTNSILLQLDFLLPICFFVIFLFTLDQQYKDEAENKYNFYWGDFWRLHAPLNCIYLTLALFVAMFSGISLLHFLAYNYSTGFPLTWSNWYFVLEVCMFFFFFILVLQDKISNVYNIFLTGVPGIIFFINVLFYLHDTSKINFIIHLILSALVLTIYSIIIALKYKSLFIAIIPLTIIIVGVVSVLFADYNKPTITRVQADKILSAICDISTNEVENKWQSLLKNSNPDIVDVQLLLLYINTEQKQNLVIKGLIESDDRDVRLRDLQEYILNNE